MTTPEQNRAATDAAILDAAAGVIVSRYGLLTSGDIYTALRNRAEAIRAEGGLPPVPSLQIIGWAQPSGLVVREALRPKWDVVRSARIDDPGGGVLDGAPDRLALPIPRRGQIAASPG